MMKKKLLTVIMVFLSVSLTVYSQNIQQEKTLEQKQQQLSRDTDQVNAVESLIAQFGVLELPPLEELIENARNSSTMKVQYSNIEVSERELKTTRRSWLSFFRGNASYSYGRTNNLLLFQETNIPVADKYTSNANSYFLLGANMSVSLEDLFNMRNKVKQKKATLNGVKYQADLTYEQLKLNIMQCYSNIQRSLFMVGKKAENIKLVEALYEDAKVDFVNGKIGKDDLSTIKANEVKAFQEFNDLVSSITEQILLLEFLSGVKILK